MPGPEAEFGARIVIWVIRIGGVALLALAAVCHMIPRNRLSGIRFPYTLADDEIWRKVHRRGRWFFLVLGLGCFVPIHSLRDLVIFTIAFMGGLFLAVGYTYVYARREYRAKFGTTKVVPTGLAKFRPPTEEERTDNN